MSSNDPTNIVGTTMTTPDDVAAADHHGQHGDGVPEIQLRTAAIGDHADAPTGATKVSEGSTDAAKVKLADLSLAPRIVTSLEGAGIKSAAGLARKSASQLKELDGIGEKAVEEISEALASYGLTLKAE